MAYTDDLPLPTRRFFSPLERLSLRSLGERQDMLDEIQYIPPTIRPRVDRPDQLRSMDAPWCTSSRNHTSSMLVSTAASMRASEPPELPEFAGPESSAVEGSPKDEDA
jgi:hypothetical protein